MDQRHIILHLSLIEGLGATAIHAIKDAHTADWDWSQLYTYSLSDLCHLGLSEKIANRLHAGLQDRTLVEKEIDLIARHNVQWATFFDSHYPLSLQNSHYAPPILYWFGTLDASNCLAIVGSRKANEYAKNSIAAIVPDLVAHNFTIVSGGAIGVDTMAHVDTLNAGGKTIVVLGSGLLRIYPYENKKLFERVVAHGGAVVSSFPMRARPLQYHFPARNRIVSGLSRGVIVVQAAKKSGAKITAQYALDQGRDVFAIPGSITDPLSEGCHALIREGATLVTNANDILREYGIIIPESSEDEKKSKKKQTKEIDLNEQQKAIFVACRHAQAIDDLAEELSLDLVVLQQELFALQMQGVIDQDFSGRWRVV